MSQPLVTIIIPCYNYGTFLADAVNSVCMQTYQVWECIIIDDGSEDNTGEIAAELIKKDSRIIYHYKTNGGLSSARNYGISIATGDYICFLDADDLLDKAKLKEQVSCFAKNPMQDVVYGRSVFFEKGDTGKLYADKLKSPLSDLTGFSGSGQDLISLLNKENIMVVSAPLIKKEVFNKTGNFDESYKSYEDWQFWIRCALAGCSFKYYDKPSICTYIRFGHESMMSNKKKLAKAAIQLRRYLASRLPLKFRFYNYYRLLRSRLKLLVT